MAKKYGMAIDFSRCMGCRTCMVACKMENGTPASHFFMYVFRYTEGSYPSTKVRYLPRPCMHCAEAPCVTACTAKARINFKSGLVLTDVDMCEGLRKCESACPYGANYFNVDDPAKNQYLDWKDSNAQLGGMFPNWTPALVKKYKDDKGKERRVAGSGFRKDTVGKCTFCVHRLEAGTEVTACQQACPAGAILFGDLNDSSSTIAKALKAAGSKAVQLKTSAGTKPSVYYIGAAPASDATPFELAPLKKGVQKKGDAKLKEGTVPWK